MIVLFEYQPGYVIAKLGGTFTRASTAGYFDVNGVLQTASSGVLRDGHYIGGVRTTLLEGSRTNLCLQSATMTNAAWAATRASWNTSAVVAPDGTTMFKLVEDSTATNTHLGLQNAAITVVNASTYTSTVFAKAGERTWFALQEGSGVTATAYFNLATGAVGTVSGTGSPSAAIQALTGTNAGIYRCSLTWTASGTSANIRLFLATGDGGAVYSGNGASGAYFWGGDMELGAFQSSYIATTTASVTRAADALTFPISFAPQALTIYANLVDLGSYQAVNNPYYASLGNPGTSPNMRAFIQVLSSTGTTMRVGDSNAETSVITTNIAYGNTVEVRGIMDANQGVNMGASINGGTEIVGTDSGARASLDTVFSGGVLGLTYGNTNGNVFHALSKLVIASGIQSLATMRAVPNQNTGQSTTQTLSPISVIAEQAFFGQPLATAIDTGTATALQAVATCPNGQSQVRVTSVTVSTSAAPAAGTPVQIIDQGTGLPIWQVTLSATGPFRRTFKFDPKPIRGSIGANVTAEMASAGGSVVQTIEMTFDTVASP